MVSIKNLRLIAVVAVATGLLLLGLSNYRYGFAVQSGLVVSIAPLLFAGLLLGRRGVWATLACVLPSLLLGAWVDWKNSGADTQMQAVQDMVSSLIQPVLGTVIVALILDQLLARVEAGNRLNRDLVMLCERLEEEIAKREQSQLQLIHSQRVDALGKLSSNIAHDFNNLLFIVLGYVRRAEGVAGDNESVRHFLHRIDLATHRGQTLTAELLSLARRNVHELELFDVSAVVESLEPLLTPLFEIGVEVRIQPADAPAPVWMERDGLEATLLNMAKNASDALGEHGRFDLSVAVEGADVAIRIEDDGQGMPPEVAARIFEPFYTTKPRGRGTGIGLAMADRVVTEAGGSIQVDSAPGEGTRFTIRLPLVQQAPSLQSSI